MPPRKNRKKNQKLNPQRKNRQKGHLHQKIQIWTVETNRLEIQQLWE